MRTIKPRGKTGFAIVEVLIATVVLAIGFIELTRAFKNISSVAVRAVAMTRASNLAHATMERVMAQNFDARGNDLEFGDYALSFDGTDDYVDTGNSFQTTFDGSFTISLWVKLDDGNPSPAPADPIQVFGTENLSGEDRVILEVGSTGIINFYYESNNNNISLSTSSAVFSDGPTAWTHVALVAPGTGSNLLIYINGKPVDVTGSSIPEMSTWASGDEVFIGANDAAGTAENHFAGYIDEFRIWNDVRTPAEILANYNRSLSDPYEEANLKLYLRMNNETGTVAFDHSSSMAHGTINGATYTSGSISWTSNSNLGAEGEASWSKYNDVDDFYTISFVDNDYAGLDSATNNFTGMGGRIYVKYVSINTNDPRDGTIDNPYTFDDSVSPTNYKQITVKVGIPGTTDSTQLDAIKSAKVNQGYSLTFSPYGT